MRSMLRLAGAARGGGAGTPAGRRAQCWAESSAVHGVAAAVTAVVPSLAGQRATRTLGKTGLVRRREVWVSVRGMLQVHCAPPALCPHVEWAVAGVLGVPVAMPWVAQPASPGAMRAELSWQGYPGAGGGVASALAAWNLLRFEVTEDGSPGCDAVRYSHTPALGTFTAVIAANGDVMIPEGRLRAAMALAATARSRQAQPNSPLGTLLDLHAPRHPALGGSLEAELSLLLGQPWDDELEPFRRAGDGAPVRWLNATG
jgi:hypothetical protein